jgi:hypothetical protein
LELFFELVEFVGVVQAHGSAKNTFDEAANESFVSVMDLEVDRGLVEGCVGRLFCTGFAGNRG